jgi:hypothetical protein
MGIGEIRLCPRHIQIDFVNQVNGGLSTLWFLNKSAARELRSRLSMARKLLDEACVTEGALERA